MELVGSSWWALLSALEFLILGGGGGGGGRMLLQLLALALLLPPPLVPGGELLGGGVAVTGPPPLPLDVELTTTEPAGRCLWGGTSTVSPRLGGAAVWGSGGGGGGGGRGHQPCSTRMALRTSACRASGLRGELAVVIARFAVGVARPRFNELCVDVSRLVRSATAQRTCLQWDSFRERASTSLFTFAWHGRFPLFAFRFPL